MKKPEKRERENLARIFYTIIKESSSFSFPITLSRGKFQIRIQPIAIPETPFPSYAIGFIINYGISILALITLTMSIGNYGNYEVRNFKSVGGRKAIKEAIKVIKNETN